MGANGHQPMAGHTVPDLRLTNVTHMCPECGHPPKALCGTCHGTGNVTDLELAAWQRRVWVQSGGFGP